MASNDNPPAAEPVARALAVDDENDAYWRIVWSLQRRGDHQTFDVAAALIRSRTPAQRRLGVDIIARLGGAADGSRPFVEQALPVLLESSRTEHDHDTLRSTIAALGHQDARALPGILTHLAHPSSDVRLSVAMALPACAQDPANADPEIVNGLLRLMGDAEAAVRNWATFGVGTLLETDTPAVRQALLERAGDPDDVTAGEALLGLAERGDGRIVPMLRGRLLSLARTDADDRAVDLCTEAAALLGDQALLPALAHLDAVRRRTGAVPLDWLSSAIDACGGAPEPS